MRFSMGCCGIRPRAMRCTALRARVSGGRAVRAAELGETLERIADEGVAPLYTGDLAERIVAHVQSGGGALAMDDLARYEVIPRDR